MKFFKAILLFILLVNIQQASAQDVDYTYARPADNQAWLWFQLDKDLTKHWNVGAQYQVRFNNDMSTFKWSFFFANATYHFNKHFSAQGVFQFGESYITNWYAFFGCVTYRHWFGKWRISVRSAIQSEHPYLTGLYDPNNPSTLEWRNRFTLKYALTKKITLMGCVEPYYRFDYAYNYFSRSRNIVGLEWEFMKHHTINPFYMWQPDISSAKPVNEHVIGLVYSISLPHHKVKKKKEN